MSASKIPFRPSQGGSYVIPKTGGKPQRVAHTRGRDDPDHPANKKPVPATPAADAAKSKD